jgi:hypothetical protein
MLFNRNARFATVNNVHVRSFSWQVDHKRQLCRLQLPCRTMQQEAQPAAPRAYRYHATSRTSYMLNIPPYKTVHT